MLLQTPITSAALSNQIKILLTFGFKVCIRMMMMNNRDSSDCDKEGRIYNEGYSTDYENDDFYADIRRQIMLLMGDDESDRNRKVPPCSGRVRQVVPAGSDGFGDYLSSCSDSTPDWLVNLWRRSSSSGIKNCSGSSNVVGTGVFIPQIVKCRGRNRPGRRRNEGNMMMNKKQVESIYL
ncbi:hypothetical protein LINGRAHAP2_LOCUS9570 [Linum grandiflorum]